MGRRKIEIQPITHERNRSVTFLKRKNGLFKKAYELGVLCSVDIAVIVFEDRPGHGIKLYQYGSSDPRGIVQRHLRFDGERDTKLPRDFNGTGGDDGDEDDAEEDDLPAPEPEPAPAPRRVPTPLVVADGPSSRKRSRRATTNVVDELPAGASPHPSDSPANNQYAIDVDPLRSFAQSAVMHAAYNGDPQPSASTFQHLQSLFHPGSNAPHNGAPYHPVGEPHPTGAYGELLRPSMRMVQEGFYPPSAHAAHGAGMRQPGMANNGYNYGMDQNGFDWPVHNASNAHQPRQPHPPPPVNVSTDAWYDYLAYASGGGGGGLGPGFPPVPQPAPASTNTSPTSPIPPAGPSSFRAPTSSYAGAGLGGGGTPLSPHADARPVRIAGRRRESAATANGGGGGASVGANVSWERGSARGAVGERAGTAPAGSRPSTAGSGPGAAELAAEALADSVLALTSLAGGKRTRGEEEKGDNVSAAAKEKEGGGKGTRAEGG